MSEPKSEPKVTPFRFTDEELEVLGVIEGHTGIRSRTDALKSVLREHTRPAGAGKADAKSTEPANPAARSEPRGGAEEAEEKGE